MSVVRKIDPRLRKVLEEVGKRFPTLAWIPNNAQRRMADPWRERNEDGRWPFMVVSSCGNGTGKTDLLPQDLVGCLCGPEYLSDYLKDHRFYHECKQLRESGEFQYRILCSSQDVMENGSLYRAVRKYIPSAKFVGKQSSGAYKGIEMPLPHNPKVKNFVDIKWFEQEVVAHSGANLHRIAINEPPPFPVWAETISRIRSAKGAVQCTILVNATVLDQATWLFDLEKDKFFENKIVYVQGSIWENCVGEELTAEIAAEIKRRYRVRLEKDPKTGHYVTNGHLTRESIEIQIHAFEQTDPNQIEARIWGANVQLVGSEFKDFHVDVHVVPARIVPKNVPIIQVVDPHPVKPDLSGWFYVDHMDRMHWFMEYPTKPWEKIKTRDMDIATICAQWRELESRMGIADQVVCRVGDPNRFKTSDSRDLSALWMLYVPHGFTFNLFVNDSLEFGHQAIHTFLYYNKLIYEKDSLDPAGWPRMTVSDACPNIKNGLMSYGRKANKDPLAAPNEQMDKTFKDAVDIVRYGCVYVSGKRVQELLDLRGGGGDDYQRIVAGRETDGYDEPISAERLKGRQLVAVYGG